MALLVELRTSFMQSKGGPPSFSFFFFFLFFFEEKMDERKARMDRQRECQDERRWGVMEEGPAAGAGISPLTTDQHDTAGRRRTDLWTSDYTRRARKIQQVQE